MNFLQTERRPKLREFSYEPFYTPQALLRRAIGLPAPELVVEDYRSFIPKFRKGIQIRTWRTGSSVNQDKRDSRSLPTIRNQTRPPSTSI